MKFCPLKKELSLSLLLLVFFCGLEANFNNTTLHTRIKNLVQKSIPYEEQADQDADVFHEYLAATIINQLHPIAQRRHEDAFKIISMNDSTRKESIIQEDTTWTNLNFFAGKSTHDTSISSIIDQTLSSLGKAQLQIMLGSTTNDPREIKRRQTIVKYFLNNPQLLQEVRTLIKKFSTCEAALLSFWHRDPLMHRIHDHYDFKDFLLKNFNNNTTLLNFKYLYKTGKTISNCYTEAFGASALMIYTLSQFIQYDPDNILRDSAAEHKSRNIFISYLWHKNLIPINVTIATLGAYYLFTSSLESADWICDLIMYDEVLHLKMKMAQEAFQSILTITSKMPKELCVLEPSLSFQYKPTELDCKETDELLELLTDKNFSDKSSGITCNRGKLVLALKLMNKHKNILLPALQALGILDCYSSLAEFLQNNSDTYSFATFEQATTPHLVLNDFINPLVSKKPVSNSIELGGNDQPRNCVITGPNAGGKSTLIKAIGINILLAQSIGIAAAKQCQLTPFSYIASYLNITDDIAAGNSRYKAETLRALELLEKSEQLPQNEFSLLLFDELFNGTTPLEGSASAFVIIKHLGFFKNSITAVATHFKLLTTLEDNLDASFKNYKVCVSINDDGSLTYPFKLESGISNQHIALDVLRNEGCSNKILDEAVTIIKTASA